MDKPPPFKVIDGLPAPDTPQERLHKSKPAELVRCRCGSNSVLQVRLGMTYRNGKASGGQKALVCAMCLANGKHVLL